MSNNFFAKSFIKKISISFLWTLYLSLFKYQAKMSWWFDIFPLWWKNGVGNFLLYFSSQIGAQNIQWTMKLKKSFSLLKLGS